MGRLERSGPLEGLAEIMAGLLEGNLAGDPERARLLEGRPRTVVVSGTDLDRAVTIVLGGGRAVVSEGAAEGADLVIAADSTILLDLPNAKLLGGLPSVFDPVGRRVVGALLTGRLKVSNPARIGLLRRVQRLVSV